MQTAPRLLFWYHTKQEGALYYGEPDILLCEGIKPGTEP